MRYKYLVSILSRSRLLAVALLPAAAQFLGRPGDASRGEVAGRPAKKPVEGATIHPPERDRSRRMGRQRRAKGQGDGTDKTGQGGRSSASPVAPGAS